MTMLSKSHLTRIVVACLFAVVGANTAQAYYAPQSGRFISRDPIMYPDGANTYAAWYVPAGVDPTGTAEEQNKPTDKPDTPTLPGEELDDGTEELPIGQIQQGALGPPEGCSCVPLFEVKAHRQRPKNIDGTSPPAGSPDGTCKPGRVVLMKYKARCKGQCCSGGCFEYVRFQCNAAGNKWGNDDDPKNPRPHTYRTLCSAPGEG